MTVRVRDKVVLVAGAGDNMGRAIPCLLAREGARLLLVSRNEEALRVTAEAARRYTPSVAELAADLSQVDTAKAAVEAAKRAFGRLDALVYVAGGGFQPDAGLAELSPEAWDATTQNILRGPFLLAQAAEEELAQQQGSITLVTAGLATRQMGSPAYAAGKAGVEGFARNLARRLWPRHVRVNLVAPGLIWYRYDALDPVPDRRLDRYGAAIDVAYAVLYLVSDEANWVSGASIVVDGGDDVLLLPAERRRA